MGATPATTPYAKLWQGDAARLPLADASVHCVVTSPPYFSLRDYGVAGQIGLEKTPEEYVAALVNVFREVRRVLRADGTLWLNLGDSYATRWSSQRNEGRGGLADNERSRHGCSPAGYKSKDLLGIPWRVAFALQADGWYLRSAMPWVKRGPMPESVSDRPATALEYVFLLAKGPRYFFDMEAVRRPHQPDTLSRREIIEGASGTGRPRYSEDGMGSCPSGVTGAHPNGRNFRNADLWFQSIEGPHGLTGVGDELVGLDVTSEPYKGSHFATFPSALVRPCILAGTSAEGCCPTCGSPWRRQVAKRRVATRPGKATKIKVPSGWDTGPGAHGSYHRDGRALVPEYRDASEVGNRDPQRHCTTTTTAGWAPACKCAAAGPPVPCVVLDPFAGSGTTPAEALRLGRHGLGCDLSAKYLALAERRLQAVRERVAMPLFDGGATEPNEEVPMSLFEECDSHGNH